jgi:hypothetical protein
MLTLRSSLKLRWTGRYKNKKNRIKNDVIETIFLLQ